jgi:septum formation protein
MHLVLASGSPRRAELLRNAGFAFEIVTPDIDERQRSDEPPSDYVQRLAEEKSLAGLRSRDASPDLLVLGADTAVIVDGDVLGKPRDEQDAGDMLRRLSGRWHDVITGVCVRGPEKYMSRVATTSVQFASLTAADVDWYVASGECRDKAGAYAIQGLASRFILRIEGSYANVVGLPVALVCGLLKALETRYSRD